MSQDEIVRLESLKMAYEIFGSVPIDILLKEAQKIEIYLVSGETLNS